MILQCVLKSSNVLHTGWRDVEIHGSSMASLFQEESLHAEAKRTCENYMYIYIYLYIYIYVYIYIYMYIYFQTVYSRSSWTRLFGLNFWGVRSVESSCCVVRGFADVGTWDFEVSGTLDSRILPQRNGRWMSANLAGLELLTSWDRQVRQFHKPQI